MVRWGETCTAYRDRSQHVANRSDLCGLRYRIQRHEAMMRDEMFADPWLGARPQPGDAEREPGLRSAPQPPDSLSSTKRAGLGGLSSPADRVTCRARTSCAALPGGGLLPPTRAAVEPAPASGSPDSSTSVMPLPRPAPFPAAETPAPIATKNRPTREGRSHHSQTASRHWHPRSGHSAPTLTPPRGPQ